VSSVQNKPFAPACERNKHAIEACLRALLNRPGQTVLELGSGTGQHAVHLAAALPHLQWQPSDLPERLQGIALWQEEAAQPNLRAPLALDVLEQPWPVAQADAVFSANTAHILPWSGVEAMFEGVAQMLAQEGLFCLYGPFHRGGAPTSAGNAAFDAQLRAQGTGMGIRDLSELQTLAERCALRLAEDHPMPANNALLVWRFSHKDA
jgi:cyclopropane fatty-acyl-phospholipid synthase-like methyltransferase